MDYNFYVYILASGPNGTLYTGVTKDLVRRVYEHKHKIIKGFTSKYSVDKLVYYEHFDDINKAIEREKNIKKWKRNWKLRIIIEGNSEWKDLYDDLVS